MNNMAKGVVVEREVAFHEGVECSPSSVPLLKLAESCTVASLYGSPLISRLAKFIT
ncbi:hypothetical protein TorRG33x02_358270 [Trema orientale]|uniref:Uncharacterized protein n=1 Tax=Trema orientale TaxID=63057 RepID=A0A2P5A415_TREOI|nr:hypothetical protein TorRG33x02_358270 [Trema orientale]